MPSPFRQLDRQQFADLLATFPFKRKITSVHMHHTWKPDRAGYHGHATIVGMWEYHTQKNHWSDIAQHISIEPDGSIWLGRNWNKPPASAKRYNGDKDAGPFMFEMIGNFDVDHDPFDGEQRRTTLEVIARVQSRFRLAPETLRMHNMMSQKTCPGSSIDYQEVLDAVSRLRASMTSTVQAAAWRTSFAEEPFMARQCLHGAIEDLQRATGRPQERPDAEGCRHGADDPDGPDDAMKPARSRAAAGTPPARPY